jgi:hypothetical protein
MLTSGLVISFYSSSIFENAGYSATEALYASLGYGAVQVVFTIPTLFLIDTKGRRTLCLIVSSRTNSSHSLTRLTDHHRHSPSCASSYSQQAFPC